MPSASGDDFLKCAQLLLRLSVVRIYIFLYTAGLASYSSSYSRSHSFISDVQLRVVFIYFFFPDKKKSLVVYYFLHEKSRRKRRMTCIREDDEAGIIPPFRVDRGQ